MHHLTQQLTKIEQNICRLEGAITRQRAWIDWNKQRAQPRSVSDDMLTTLQDSLSLFRQRRLTILDELNSDTTPRA